jgi:DNA-binding protein YbaB
MALSKEILTATGQCGPLDLWIPNALRMVETHDQRTERLLRELADVRATAESDDNLIATTVDRGGRLHELHLDPRIYRTLDVDELADGIVATTRQATKLARRQAAKVAADLLPGRIDPDRTDLGFDLVIDELDRRIANPSPPYRGDPPDETLPVLQTSLDFRTFRQNVVDLREQMAEMAGEARSDDGLIEATTDGYGRLRDLRLDRRLFRVTDSRRLAADITRTVGQAADQAGEQVARANEQIWSSASGRRS